MKIFPWDVLAAEDKDKVEYWIERFGGNGEFELGSHRPLSHLLRYWNEAKAEYLMEMFDNQLILSRDVEINAIAEDIYAELTSLKRENSFIYKFSTFINRYCYLDEYRNNRDVYYDYEIPYALGQLINNGILKNNKYDYMSITLIDDNGKKVRIEQYCKPLKALHTLNKKFKFATEEEFEEFRIKHSQILNNKTLKGTLHLSIHPLDYMTMSDNGCGWTSCMNWEDRGDYRMGTIEMMNSPMVVVAYLDASKPFYLDGDKTAEWSNKKWRELFIVDPSLILGIKGYPYCNNELENICLDWLKDLAAAHPDLEMGPYTQYRHGICNDTTNTISENDIELNLSTYIECNCMYNDIYDTHVGYIGLNASHLHMNYSGVSMCIACGKDCGDDFYNEDWEHHHCICVSCSGFEKCEYCGEYHYIGDLSEVCGKYVCEYCRSEYLYECAKCGKEVFSVDCSTIYLACCSDYSYDHMHKSEYICVDCFDKLKERFNAQWKRVSTWCSEYVIDLENVADTPENRELLKEVFDLNDYYLNRMWDKITPKKAEEEEVFSASSGEHKGKIYVDGLYCGDIVIDENPFIIKKEEYNENDLHFWKEVPNITMDTAPPFAYIPYYPTTW